MDNVETPSRNSDALIELTADVVAAYVSNNPVPVGELPNLIADVHAALGRVGGTAEAPVADKQKPAVNPKRSVHDDYIVCLEDGKKFKSLKRHLMTHYGLTQRQSSITSAVAAKLGIMLRICLIWRQTSKLSRF